MESPNKALSLHSMAQDFFGNEITLGCDVAFMQTKYRNFVMGKVVKITDKTIEISHDPTNTFKKNTKQSHNQVIVKKL